MNKTEQETLFSEETIKFRPHIVYKFFGPFSRPRRLLKGWHLFPFHPVKSLVKMSSFVKLLIKYSNIASQIQCDKISPAVIITRKMS